MQILLEEQETGIGTWQVARLNGHPLDNVGHLFGGFMHRVHVRGGIPRIRPVLLDLARFLYVAVLILYYRLPRVLHSRVKTEICSSSWAINWRKEGANILSTSTYYEVFVKGYFDFFQSAQGNRCQLGVASRRICHSLRSGRRRTTTTTTKRRDEQSQAWWPDGRYGMACYATFLSMGIDGPRLLYVPACNKERLAKSNFHVTIVHGDKALAPVSTSRKYLEVFPSKSETFEGIPNADYRLFDHPRAAEIVKKTLQRVSD
jgi:hypothetical protein